MKTLILKFIGAIILPALAQAQIPEGFWSTGCSLGLQKSQQITAAMVQMSEVYFQDRNCEIPSFEFITTGSIAYPNSTEQTNPIDFTYTQIELKIYHDFVVQNFNERQVCGFKDWQQATPKDITGKQCALFNFTKPSPIPQKGEQKFGIYKVEDNRLYYGKLSQERDSSSPEKRPQEYDTLFYSLPLP